jgi:hypothetical protein
MDKKILSEELERMLGLFGHKRGVVVSEQTYSDKGSLKAKDRKWKMEKPGNWRRGKKGEISFVSDEELKGNAEIKSIPNAVKVRYNGVSYDLYADTYIPTIYKQFLGSSEPPTPPTKEPGGNVPPKNKPLPGLTLDGDNLPFNDNQIGPKFSDKRFEKAKIEIDGLILAISNYINGGCYPSLKYFEFTGSADSANPTQTNADHTSFGFSSNYNGLRDLNKMNLFLAENRAKNITKYVVDKVKESTGIDLIADGKIKYGEPISYLGQQNRRGSEWRSVKITPTQDECISSKPILGSETSGTGLPGSEGNVKTDEVKQPTNVEFIDLSMYGGPDKVPVGRYVGGGNSELYIGEDLCNQYGVNINEVLTLMPAYEGIRFDGESRVNGKIENNKLFVGKYSFGDIKPIGDFTNEDINKSFKFCTEGRFCKKKMVKTKDNKVIYIITKLSFGFGVRKN